MGYLFWGKSCRCLQISIFPQTKPVRGRITAGFLKGQPIPGNESCETASPAHRKIKLGTNWLHSTTSAQSIDSVQSIEKTSLNQHWVHLRGCVFNQANSHQLLQIFFRKKKKKYNTRELRKTGKGIKSGICMVAD